MLLAASVLLFGRPAKAAGPADDARPVLARVDIAGNEALSDGQLKALMNNRASAWYAFLPWVSLRHYDPKAFGQDVQRILARYRNVGYLDATADTTVRRKGDGVHLGIRIEEGDLYRVGSVALRGLAAAPAADSASVAGRLRTRADRPLRKAGLEQDRDMIVARLKNSGHAFATVSAELDVDRHAHRADVTFRASPGPRCAFGEIRVQGNRRVAESVVRSGLTFRSGDLFRRRDFLSSQRLLYQSGAFRSVLLNLPDSVRETSPVDVVVSVTERKPRSLKLGGGYGTEEEFRASVSWQHRNFLGRARQLSLDAEASALQAKASLNIVQPYVWGSRTWLRLAGFVEQARPEEVRVKRVGGSSTVERYLRNTARISVSVRADLVDFKADSTTTSILLSFQEDARDDYFNPRNGRFVSVEVKESGYLFTSDHEFLKLTAEARWYRRIPWRGVVAARLAGGTIRELGAGVEVPNYDRYFAGGATSVRGWSLNRLGPRDVEGVPTGGLSLFEGSLELRHRLFWSFGGAVFLDAGAIGQGRADAFRPDELGWSAGAGLRYLTVIGPIRFDVARRLSRDPGEAETQYYLSLGQAF